MIDLHCHSTCSDGSETPARVVELAVEAGCTTLALTDHDNVAGLAEARRRAADLGIGFIGGCEVSCGFEPGTMHLLCYFVGAPDDALARLLEELRAARERRNVEMLERFAALSMPITFAEVAAEAGSSVIGRPHVAAVLVRHGWADSIDDAFTRWLAKGRPGYVEKDRLSPGDIIDATVAVGGVTVLAHPLSLGLAPDGLAREVRGLAARGLGGLESFYARYDDTTRQGLAALARSNHLVPTGGSDFHGRFKPDISIGTGTGDLAVPDSVVDELDAARRTR